MQGGAVFHMRSISAGHSALRIPRSALGKRSGFQVSAARSLAGSMQYGLARLDRGWVHSYPLNMRQVLIHPGQDGYWVAECPSLPGCVSQGATREESIRNIQEAIEGYIAVLREDGLPVPEDKLEALLLAV